MRRAWVFLLGLALSSGPPSARAQDRLADFEVSVGVRAHVVNLPRLHPVIVELMVQDAQGDLSVLGGRDTRQIAEVDPVFRGGGSWLLRIRLRDPNTHIEAVIEDGQLKLSVKPGSARSRLPPQDTPTIEELLANAVQGPAPEPLPAMRFMHGEAASMQLPTDEYPLTLGNPGWLAEDKGGWRRLDDARLEMFEAKACGQPCQKAQAEKTYELGWRYLNMGWSREASHYLNQLPTDNPALINPLDVTEARARASIENQRWEDARTLLSEAWLRGASTATIIEGLALVSLQTGVPARTPTAQLLSSSTADPMAQLLAAELMQIDGQYSASIPILEPLLATLEGKPQQLASLRLGDALLINNQIDEARRAWQTAPSPLSEFRAIYGEMYRMGPDAWVRLVPLLEEVKNKDPDLGAEAHYLLLQIDQSLGIEVDAINEMVSFIDDNPRLALKTDVPSSLWRLYARRAVQLHEEEKWYAMAALHESSWRNELFAVMDDPTILWKVSEGYENVGLPGRAVEVLADGFKILIDRDEPNVEMTLKLAELYDLQGEPKDGLKTINYLRTLDVPEEMEGRIALTAGRMLLQLNRRSDGLQELKVAQRDPEQRDEAELFMATVSAEEGRCDAATSTLERLLLSEAGQARWAQFTPYLILTRCADTIGDMALAARAAEAAAQRAISPEQKRYAAYLVAMYSGDPTVKADEESDDIWTALVREEKATIEFEGGLKNR
ncbi:MAG: hypothetical protein AAFV53_35155 [Myxococcota bacterium]